MSLVVTRAVRGALAGAACLALTLAAVAVARPAQARDVDPYAPAAGHAYRHGAVPTRAAAAGMNRYRAAHPDLSGANLGYGGGVDGIGVTTGKPRVYLVFWGAQWGSAGTDAAGDTTLSGDAAGVAPRLQQFFKGVGVNELWSGVMTQYCEGVSTGAQTCPANVPHVGYPDGGALAGVWADTRAAEPATATAHQIGVEAVAAASHFGNTGATANRSAQYVIVSPHGTHPDGFNAPGGNFCAWHDWNGDDTLPGGPVTSNVGDIAFTNMPYVVDAADSCGEGVVNSGSNGTLDGVTIVEGHEYAETITDQNPAGGWLDAAGEENGDKCAWLRSGSGAMADVPFATGSFAVQSTWANDAAGGKGGCAMVHTIVGGGSGNDLIVSVDPQAASASAGQRTTLTATVTTSAVPGAPPVALSVTGAPAGVTVTANPATVTAGKTATLTVASSGSTPPGNYVIIVAGRTGSSNAVASYSLAVVPNSGSVTNGGFETGLSGWTSTGVTAAVSDPVHTGLGAAQIGSTGPANTSTLVQAFTTAAGQTKVSFWYQVVCTDIVQLDWFTATLRDNTTGKTTTVVPDTCDLGGGYKQATAPVTAGHRYTLTLLDHDDHATGDPTYTYVDEVGTS